MIYKRYFETIVSGALNAQRPAKMNQIGITQITFEKLSLKGKTKALEMGFCPAVSLDETRQCTDIGYLYFDQDCEVSEHLLAILFDNSVWIRTKHNHYQLTDFTANRFN